MFSRCERLEVRADGGAAVGEMAMEEDTDAPTAAEAQAQQVRMSAQKARHQGSPHMLPDGTITRAV